MKFFADRKTSTKLFIGFGVIAAFTFAVGALSSSVMHELMADSEQMYRGDLDAVVRIERVRNVLASASRDTRRAVLARDQKEVDKWLAAGGKLIASYDKEIHAYLEKNRAAQRDLESFRVVDRDIAALVQTHSRALERVAAGDGAGARALLLEAEQLAGRVDEALASLAATNAAGAQAAFTRATDAAARARNQIIMLVLSSALIGLFVATLIARFIGQGFNRAADALERVADGDFTQKLELDSKDEVGQMATALNEAVSSVQLALDEVRSVASDVASASTQLSGSSQGISTGAQEQASALEETAASLEQITGTIKQNSDNAQQAARLATSSRAVADQGRKVVGSAVGAMGEISQSSGRIVEIIATIDDIAFQTNLLALNAAVEAARAGEQGRGFAVVATEVRNLAQRSATSAKEIKALIEESVQRIESGKTLVNRSGTALDEIVGGVKRVTDIVSEIAAASKEQSTGIEQVNKAVTQMDGVTQSNAGQTEELSATAQTLAQRASQLQELVGRFKLASSRLASHSSSASVLGPPSAERGDSGLPLH